MPGILDSGNTDILVTKGPKMVWRAFAIASTAAGGVLLSMMPDAAYAQWGGYAYPYGYEAPIVFAPPPFGYGAGFAGPTSYGTYDPRYGGQLAYGGLSRSMLK